MSKLSFYCKNLCIPPDFSIDEWNEVYKALELTNLTEQQKTEILHPTGCLQQCFDCLAIVGVRQLRTKQLC